MNENTKEITIPPVTIGATNSQTIEYLIYFILGTMNILLVFRLILKLMGASSTSVFVGVLYTITGLLVYPFEGIFRKGTTQGIETTSILEPSTIVAIIVYSVLALGIVKLVRIVSGKSQENI